MRLSHVARPAVLARPVLFAVLILLLARCAPPSSTAPLYPKAPLSSPANTVSAPPVVATTAPVLNPSATTLSTVSSATSPAQGEALTSTPGAEPTYDPQSWKDLPVIPELGPRALEILKAGLAKGNNPHVFSKIGDCESQASWFLGDFDGKPTAYSLGSYQTELQPVIQYYSGSYARLSLAARPGFSAASLLAPIWADKQRCGKDETPLACEIRTNHPLVAFILLGSNDASNPKTFEGHMRTILDETIAQGVLPVIGTKADNVEGDYFINATIARLAHEYGLPLWNYWRAVQPLPDHGLQADKVHLTFGTPQFDDPAMMQKAWPVRNLNALLILEKVMADTK